jgi:cold shock CspA family protein
VILSKQDRFSNFFFAAGFVMAQPQHRRQTGSVKWFSGQRGYGFTAPSDGSENVFVHYSSLKSDGRLHLQPNTSIEYEILRGSEGKTQAINATAPGGRLLPNSRKLGPGENITGSSSSSKSMSSRNSNTSSFNNVGPCFICGQLGHFISLLSSFYL